MRHIGTTEICTPRLILRRFAPDDLSDMYRNWASDPAVQHEYGEPVYETMEQTNTLLEAYLRSYEQPDVYRWAIVLRQSGENIGQIAFCRVWDDCRTAEIEYCIGAAFWGHGYAGEALKAVIAHTFAQADFVKLEAYHRAANVKSGRVLQKSAMHITQTVERFRRSGETPDGEICYCICKSDYPNHLNEYF